MSCSVRFRYGIRYSYIGGGISPPCKRQILLACSLYPATPRGSDEDPSFIGETSSAAWDHTLNVHPFRFALSSVAPLEPLPFGAVLPCQELQYRVQYQRTRFLFCSSAVLAPVDRCSGVSPTQAAKSRPERKVSTGGASASMAVAIRGPMPGMLMSRRAPSSRSARVAISASRATILPCSALSVSTRTARHDRAGSGMPELGSSICAINWSTCDGPWRSTPTRSAPSCWPAPPSPASAACGRGRSDARRHLGPGAGIRQRCMGHWGQGPHDRGRQGSSGLRGARSRTSRCIVPSALNVVLPLRQDTPETRLRVLGSRTCETARQALTAVAVCSRYGGNNARQFRGLERCSVRTQWRNRYAQARPARCRCLALDPHVDERHARRQPDARSGTARCRSSGAAAARNGALPTPRSH